MKVFIVWELDHSLGDTTKTLCGVFDCLEIAHKYVEGREERATTHLILSTEDYEINESM